MVRVLHACNPGAGPAAVPPPPPPAPNTSACLSLVMIINCSYAPTTNFILNSQMLRRPFGLVLHAPVIEWHSWEIVSRRDYGHLWVFLERWFCNSLDSGCTTSGGMALEHVPSDGLGSRCAPPEGPVSSCSSTLAFNHFGISLGHVPSRDLEVGLAIPDWYPECWPSQETWQCTWCFQEDRTRDRSVFWRA